MAKIKPLETISGMSGKVCMHSDIYFRTNTMNGVVTTGKRCYPYKGAASTSQIAAKNRFKLVSAAIRTRLTALTAVQKQAMKDAAVAARAGSVFGYAFQKWNSEYDATGALITTEN